jgi:flagellar export protein FliJ
MARFRFRPQPALDLRRREHEAAQRELARADLERQRAQSHVEAAERALVGAVRSADAAARTPGAVSQLDWYRSWIVRLEGERAETSEALRTHERTVLTARAASLAARRRHEALERLREKAYAAHLAGEADAERKLIDEVASQRYARRAITEGA